MHPVLTTSFEALAAELSSFDSVSAGVHPGGKTYRWTAQQIVEHLVLSLDATRKAIEQRLVKGRPERRAQRTRTEWAMQLMVLTAGYMPKGVPTLRDLSPEQHPESMGARELVRRLESSIEAMDAALDQARQHFGMERVGRHFLLGPLRVDQWRRYHVLHLRHHLRQIEEVRHTLSEPARPQPVLAGACGSAPVRR